MVEWIVVCEARGDFTVLTGLVDRLAAAELHWTDGILDSLRRWRGLEADREFTAWKDLKGLASARGLRVYSSGLRTQGPDGGARLQVQKLFALMQHDALQCPRRVLMMHDLDKLTDPSPWFEACAKAPEGMVAVCAVPVPELEAWMIVAFEPRDADERQALARETRTLGGDPRALAHTLNPGRTYTQDGAPMPRSTKRVAEALMPEATTRAERLLDCSPSELEARGEHVGLSEFVRTVRARYLPTLGG